MTFGSLFAGIEGFGLGFHRAGMQCRWQVEKDPACLRVLARHFPDVQRFEDVCAVGKKNLEPVDVICFGSPCQDLSVAGKRAGLKGKRSGLFYEACRIVRQLRPAFAVWENVPGAFSSDLGRDFYAAIRALWKCGARDLAWRVLDAQYFGLAQRRERVFAVADFRGERAGQILFEQPCRCGHPPTRKEKESRVASTIRSRSASPGISRPGRGGEDDHNLIAGPIMATDGGIASADRVGELVVANAITAHHGRNAGEDNFIAFTELGEGHVSYQRTQIASAIRTPKGGGSQMANIVAHTLRSEGADASEDGTGRGTPLVYGISCDAFDRSGGGANGTARERAGLGITENYSATIRAKRPNGVATGQTVRRLTPMECERLQGFPDGWTDGESDSARYRMIGNAVAVPVAEWIGRRMEASHHPPAAQG